MIHNNAEETRNGDYADKQWGRERGREKLMFEITNLHNGKILSTLSISSHGFTFSFPKRSHTNRDNIPYL